jgi:mRNA interferase MazF
MRGEVWWVDLGIAGKVRPVAVVSAPIGEKDYALVATVPHTTSEHPTQYSLALNAPGLKEGSFNLQGLAPVPRSKFMRKITTLNAGQMAQLDAAIKRWLALS